MTKGKNQHVVPAGNSKMTSTHSTQAEAINAAKNIAKNQKSEMFIHNIEGQIRERNTYGKDPYPPKG